MLNRWKHGVVFRWFVWVAMSYNCRQYPCKPVCLRPWMGCADDHKAGVAIFSGFRHVYRLTMAMRFDDPVLIAILAKRCVCLVAQSSQEQSGQA